LPTEVANTLHWVARASRPLSDFGDAEIGRAVLDSLKLRLDGTAPAAETVRRKRRTLVNALHYAVELGQLEEKPITGIRWKKPKVAREVDPGWSPIPHRPVPCWLRSRTSVDTAGRVVAVSSACLPA
jgi:hypothetical protein